MFFCLFKEEKLKFVNDVKRNDKEKEKFVFWNKIRKIVENEKLINRKRFVR